MHRFANTIVAALLLTLGTMPAALAKSPMTLDSYFKLKRLSDPQLSPDGKWVAYVVAEPNLKENSNPTNIFLVSIDGTHTLQLTRHEKNDNHPRFSPDGKTVAFLSNRSGSNQIWMVAIDGGEAWQLTTLATGVDDFRWAPDGKNILLIASTYRGCDDDACNQKRSEAEESSKTKVRIITEPLYRHWDSWLGDQHGRLYRLQLANKQINPISPRNLAVPPIALGGSDDFEVSPDGREVVYVANTDRDLAHSTNNDLFITDLFGRAPSRLTSAFASNDNSPRYSPDGRYLAYLSQQTPGYESDRVKIHLYDRRSGTHSVVTKDLDNWVSELTWSPDSKLIYFTVHEKGYLPIYAYSLADKRIQKIADGASYSALSPSRDGKTLVASKQSFTSPPEVVAIQTVAGTQKQLTQVNQAALADIELGNVEEFSFASSADNANVHGFLILPPGFRPSNRYPLMLVIHGGPQGAWESAWSWRWNAQLFAAPGYVAAFINPRGSTGYGQKFTAEVSRDWGGKPYADLMSGVDYLLKNHSYIDGKAMAAAGGSYGGYMVNWIQGHSNRFNALITHAGVADLFSMYGSTEEKWFPNWEFGGNPYENPEQYSKWSPMNHAKNFRTPMLIVHGENDFRVSLEQAQEMYTALHNRQVPTKMVLYSTEGHWIGRPKHSQIWWENVHGWLRQYIQGSR